MRRSLEYWPPQNFGSWFPRLIASYLLFAVVAGVAIVMAMQAAAGRLQFGFWGAGAVGVVGIFLLLRDRVLQH
jgi:hypothetical protein